MIVNTLSKLITRLQEIQVELGNPDYPVHYEGIWNIPDGQVELYDSIKQTIDRAEIVRLKNDNNRLKTELREYKHTGLGMDWPDLEKI